MYCYVLLCETSHKCMYMHENMHLELYIITNLVYYYVLEICIVCIAVCIVCIAVCIVCIHW